MQDSIAKEKKSGVRKWMKISAIKGLNPSLIITSQCVKCKVNVFTTPTKAQLKNTPFGGGINALYTAKTALLYFHCFYCLHCGISTLPYYIAEAFKKYCTVGFRSFKL